MAGADHDEMERVRLRAWLLDAVDAPSVAARDRMFRYTFAAAAVVTGAHLLPPASFADAVDDEALGASGDTGRWDVDDDPLPVDVGRDDPGDRQDHDPHWLHPPDPLTDDPDPPPHPGSDDGDLGW